MVLQSALVVDCRPKLLAVTKPFWGRCFRHRSLLRLVFHWQEEKKSKLNSQVGQVVILWHGRPKRICGRLDPLITGHLFCGGQSAGTKIWGPNPTGAVDILLSQLEPPDGHMKPHGHHQGYMMVVGSCSDAFFGWTAIFDDPTTQKQVRCFQDFCYLMQS